MDGEHITEWRTAAASAAATKMFANGFDKLTILGAGVGKQSVLEVSTVLMAAGTGPSQEPCLRAGCRHGQLEGDLHLEPQCCSGPGLS